MRLIQGASRAVTAKPPGVTLVGSGGCTVVVGLLLYRYDVGCLSHGSGSGVRVVSGYGGSASVFWAMLRRGGECYRGFVIGIF